MMGIYPGVCLIGILLQMYPSDQAVPCRMSRRQSPAPYTISTLHRIRGGPELLHGSAHQAKFENKLQFSIRMKGKDHVLTLHKAHDLLAGNFSASHYEADGRLVTESLGHQEHCCYTGSVDGLVESLVSLCTCPSLSGYITLREEIYSFDALRPAEPEENTTIKLHYHPIHPAMGAAPRRSRRSPQYSHLAEGAREPYKIELFLVADKEEFQRHGESVERTRHHLMAVAYHLNQIFLDIDFQIFLVGIEIWSEENKVNISDAADSSLLRFLEWREQVLLPRMHHDNVQLISGVRFKNHILGEAFLAQMCSESHSGGVIRDTGISPKELAKYIAHEIGHNLGMKHDTENCYCPVGPGRCLLSKRNWYDIHPVFSECSRHSLTRFLEEKNITCLMNPPHTYIEESPPGVDQHEVLETVGKVSIFLCSLIILPIFLIIWRRASGKPPQAV
ncbi:disintegrin and metalloproteinase domain-containing protein 12 [Xenopus tropicalis]|uniref:Disintegrin and metalloproteinase domain-containing protein 12 n=1 Tax=Xenopus tropicalis TaxID=8364 RepID=A0A8J1IZW9_XENTR|nr:disintegrin and metalloproteinase domain-containing protein 12 [Xenopus tropicalis]